MRAFLLLSTRATLLSLAVPSFALPPLLAYAGPAMAAGLQIYSGNTEVSLVSLPFPWLWTLAPATVGLLLLIAEKRLDTPWLWAPSAVAMVTSLAVSGSYLVRLFGQAGA